MDDLFTILIILSFVVAGVLKEIRKTRMASEAPLPDFADEEDASCPDEEPQEWLAPAVPPAPASPAPAASSSPSAGQRPYRADRHTSSPRRAQPQSPAPPSEASEDVSEYAIRTAEEARRAIVWSEILHRKYV